VLGFSVGVPRLLFNRLFEKNDGNFIGVTLYIVDQETCHSCK